MLESVASVKCNWLYQATFHLFHWEYFYCSAIVGFFKLVETTYSEYSLHCQQFHWNNYYIHLQFFYKKISQSIWRQRYCWFLHLSNISELHEFIIPTEFDETNNRYLRALPKILRDDDKAAPIQVDYFVSKRTIFNTFETRTPFDFDQNLRIIW